MRNRLDIQVGGYDLVALLLFVALVAVGWLMIFASEYNAETFNGIFDLDRRYGKQLLFIMIGVGIFGVIQLLDSKLYETLALVFYAVTLVLLVAVLFTKPINGSRSWFELGGFRLQPSEFAKMATCLLLTTYLSRSEVRLQTTENLLQALGIIALPMFLVLLQGDLGSTLVFTSFSVVLFRAGLNALIYVAGLAMVALSIWALKVDEIGIPIMFLLGMGNTVLSWNWQHDRRISAGIALAAAGMIFFYNDDTYIWFYIVQILGLLAQGFFHMRQHWQSAILTVGLVAVASLYASSVNYLVNNVLEPHQQERIMVWLRPEKCDPLGALYNVEQSKYAIGSGGGWGKGFLQGERTKLDYVPEQSTDFIFCTAGEEWGFFGSFVILGLFLGLLTRIIVLAERQRAAFTLFYAYGVIGILFFHLFINIGMTIGMMPVVGIPLPFVSYGGSSLWAFTLLMSIFFKLDSSRLY